MAMKRIFIVLITFTFFYSNASIITYGSYTLSTDSNIVSSKGIEWLQWDETAGLSIDEALNNYNGWSLASNEQMAMLFNDFFSYQVWNVGDNGGAVSLPYTEQITSQLNFLNLFGYIEYIPLGQNGNDLYTDAFYSVKAAYGSDNNGLYREAIVNDAFAGAFDMGDVLESYGVGASSELTLAQIASNVGFSQRGVAIVRTASVPEPSSLLFMIMGVLCAGMYKTRKTLRWRHETQS